MMKYFWPIGMYSFCSHLYQAAGHIMYVCVICRGCSWTVPILASLTSFCLFQFQTSYDHAKLLGWFVMKMA